MADTLRANRAHNAETDRQMRLLAILTPVATLGLIAAGGVVRVMGSGLGCPSWPLCFGQIVPPPEMTAIIEYSHRFIALMVSALVVATASLALMRYRNNPAILMPALAAGAMLAAQVALGAMTVFLELPPVVVALHLATALALLACELILATNLMAASQPSPLVVLGHRVTGLATALVGLVFILIVLGASITASGVSLACRAWPLCDADGSSSVVLHLAHRAAALGSGILILWLAVELWDVRSRVPRIWQMLVNMAALFVAQALIGAINVLSGLAVIPRELHIVFGSMVWGTAVVILVMLIRQEAVAGGRELTGSAASPFASGRITGDPAANLQLADYDHGGTHGI